MQRSQRRVVIGTVVLFGLLLGCGGAFAMEGTGAGSSAWQCGR